MRIDHLVYVLPGLVDPAVASHAPTLARALVAAGAPRYEPDGLAPLFAPFYGVDRQRDWPFAPIRLQALGVDPGNAYWLCADPIHLVAGHDDLQLARAIDDLDAQGAAALLATLNVHFASDGLAFVAPRPGDWFVHTAVAQDLQTRPLDAAIGRTLRTLLPVGGDAARWRRWQNEIQMLLHEHPVNLAREASGRVPVNSVWIWGGGHRPAPRDPGIATYAPDGIASALAAHTGVSARPRPSTLAAALTDAASRAIALIVFDRGVDAATLERDWMAPAMSSLARGGVAAFTVLGDGPDGAFAWSVPRPTLLQRLGFAAAPEWSKVLSAARTAIDTER